MWTREEIQYTVSKTIQTNNTASLHFQQPDLGVIKVDIEKSSWYSLIKTEFQLKEKPLLIELKKTIPFVCMFFNSKEVHNSRKIHLRCPNNIILSIIYLILNRNMW